MNQQQRGRYPPRREQKPPSLPQGYLDKGYFDKGNIRAELITDMAESVARSLGNAQITAAQLQRFFRQVRSIERELKSSDKFSTVIPQIAKLKASVANYVGKGNNPWERESREVFKQFIDHNIALAIKDDEGHNFKDGFIPHFESVVAYYKYHFPTRR